MRAALIATVVLGGVLAGVQPVFAQNVWTGRVRVNISAGLQPDSAGLAEARIVDDYLEPTPIAADLTETGLPFFDALLAVRVAGNLGIGVGVSNLTTTGDATVTAEIPHPFYFDRPRSISGRAFGVQRTETGVHTGLAYLIGLSEKADVVVLGGATYFRVRQDLVSDVTYSETFPYDVATFSSAQLIQATESKVGYHAGVDFTWKVSQGWGVGGLLRFARARVPVEIDGTEVATLDVGGLQAGAGLRLVF